MRMRIFTILLLLSNSINIISQIQSFIHDGIIRQYIYHEPANISPGAPLVVVMHGYSGSASGIKNYSGMNSVANQNGFAVCYPQGTSDDWSNNFWNVGYDFHPNETVDDIGFITSLVEHLQVQHNLSPLNTFATGMSNGGEMSYMLACQAPQTFTAIASVAGTMFDSYGSTCGNNSIPVMEIHGTDDGVNLWDGDYNNSTGWGVFYHMDTIIEKWSQNNFCDQLLIEYMPDIVTNDGSTIEAQKHFSNNYGNEVWLYKVIGGDHDWPGDYGNMDIDSSEEIWLFFSKYLTNVTSSNNITSFFKKKKIIAHTDLIGRKVNANHKGLIIRLYNDGSTEKIFNFEDNN